MASVQLVERLDAQRSTVMPDVTGGLVRDVRKQMPELDVQVVDFGDGSRAVTAQWPLPGEARPDDGAVVVWVGTPPEPPKPKKTKVADTGAQLADVDLPVPPPPVALPGTAEQSSVVTSPGSGVTPGLENFVAPPHGPRANIRTLPAAEPGTSFAGRASWYGPGFAGRGTACGTTFNPSELTLASREIRCGTKVVVTGPSGSVEATVTDWGPAEWTNRRFDLSQATFEAVASLGSGVIDVTVEVR